MKGTRTDASGQAIVDWCLRHDYTVSMRQTVTDETSEIVPLLAEWCDSGNVDLVLTTGGTGLSPRDVTPEATLAIIDRNANGVAEYVRAQSFDRFPRAALSRGVAGIRGSTLLINLPGSTSGVTDALTALDAIIEHAIDVVAGRNSHQ